MRVLWWFNPLGFVKAYFMICTTSFEKLLKLNFSGPKNAIRDRRSMVLVLGSECYFPYSCISEHHFRVYEIKFRIF